MGRGGSLHLTIFAPNGRYIETFHITFNLKQVKKTKAILHLNVRVVTFLFLAEHFLPNEAGFY